MKDSARFVIERGGLHGHQRVPRHRGDRREHQSWEAAARAAVETAAKTVRDLRVAEVVRQDLTIGDGGVVNFRVRLGISFKYGTED